ncbi:MAG: hypothetical protein IPO29_07735 [Anaerolineae bacterium]|nr:hypothetical protein [Anaerolineae bacterium]
MKSDIPRLMRERNIDALVIEGPDGLSASNAPFAYFVGDAHVTTGRIIITRVGPRSCTARWNATRRPRPG